MLTATQLFEAALAKVESASIRAWATSEHNRPLFIRWIDEAGATTADQVCIYIVSNAIGLW